MNINQKILDAGKPVVFFELVPPPLTSPLKPTLETIKKLTEILPFDAFNIPEIDYHSQTKYQALDLAILIKKFVVKNKPVIINQPVVYQSWRDQQSFFQKAYRKGNINTIILVGGDQSNKKYPGPSVYEAANWINRDFESKSVKFLLGGIAIATRKDEDVRMYEKSKAGISFFTSQLILDNKPVKKLLKDYAYLCRKNQCQPKRVFLSFTAISSKENVIFLHRLKVNVPKENIDYLLKGWLGIGWRSINLACKLLTDILKYNQKHKLNIPIGLNIEYITRGNFELSYLLAKELIKIYKNYL